MHSKLLARLDLPRSAASAAGSAAAVESRVSVHTVTNARTLMRTRAHARTYTHRHTHSHTREHTRARARARTRTYTHVHARIHVFASMHTHAHTHSHTQLLRSWVRSLVAGKDIACLGLMTLEGWLCFIMLACCSCHGVLSLTRDLSHDANHLMLCTSSSVLLADYTVRHTLLHLPWETTHFFLE